MTTFVDFYLLKPSSQDPTEQTMVTLCRLTEKAFSAGFTVFCRVSDGPTATYLDKLLWTFKDVSFIPHGLVSAGEQFPVIIGVGDEGIDVTSENLAIINDCSSPLSDNLFNRASRVCEIVRPDEGAKQAARVRYKGYQAAKDTSGFELRTHEI